MEINRHNYEAFLLDLLEGSLSVDDQQLLQEFLLLNPDCNAEILEGESWSLENEKVHFPDAEILKKKFPDTGTLLAEHNFDLFSIARLEGDLTRQQEEAHQLMLEIDSQKSKQWIEWQRTRLIPEQVVLKEKKQLYRRKGNRVLWLSVFSAAAAIALVFVLFRMEPGIPPRELGQEALPKVNSAQSQDHPDQVVTDQTELQKDEVGIVAIQIVQEIPSELVKKEHELPVESLELIEPGDDMQARPVKISGNMMNTDFLLGGAVPDQIKALEIPPATIHLSSLSVAQLYEMDLEEIVDDYVEEQDLSLWTVANAGLQGINKLTGSDISLLASRDEDGEVSGFRLKSRRFSMSRPLGRAE